MEGTRSGCSEELAALGSKQAVVDDECGWGTGPVEPFVGLTSAFYVRIPARRDAPRTARRVPKRTALHRALATAWHHCPHHPPKCLCRRIDSLPAPPSIGLLPPPSTTFHTWPRLTPPPSPAHGHRGSWPGGPPLVTERPPRHPLLAGGHLVSSLTRRRHRSNKAYRTMHACEKDCNQWVRAHQIVEGTTWHPAWTPANPAHAQSRRRDTTMPMHRDSRNSHLVSIPYRDSCAGGPPSPSWSAILTYSECKPHPHRSVSAIPLCCEGVRRSMTRNLSIKRCRHLDGTSATPDCHADSKRQRKCLVKRHGCRDRLGGC